MKLFPTLTSRPAAPIDLDAEAARWLAARGPAPAGGGPNPFLDPAVCQELLDEVHRREGVAWSYGGYLEDRRRLWAGSYLEGRGTFVHLGLDLHVPRGTPVATPGEADVVLVDDDRDRDGGWGPRVFLRPRWPGAEEVLLVLAHLQKVSRAPGARLGPLALVAEVGGPPDNGNWHPHLHVQAIRRSAFERVLVEGFETLDGYGRAEEMERLRATFPDPLPLVR